MAKDRLQLLATVALSLGVADLARGQLANTPKAFEVASIRVRQGDPQLGFAILGNRLTIEGFTLAELITEAYNLRPNQLQLTNGAALVRRTDVLYDIAAKADGEVPPSRDDFRQMLQSLLADRFHLQIHRQWNETAVYGLIVGKGGHKLPPASADAGPELRFTGAGNLWKISMPHGTMAGLVGAISKTAFLDRPIVDRTGLNGTFEIKLSFTPENRLNRGDAGAVPDISIFTALQEQLGLRLERQKAATEIVVVDHVEKPSAN